MQDKNFVKETKNKKRNTISVAPVNKMDYSGCEGGMCPMCKGLVTSYDNFCKVCGVGLKW